MGGVWEWSNAERLRALLAEVPDEERADVEAGCKALLADPVSGKGEIRVARMRAWPDPLKIAFLPHGWRLTFEITSDRAGEQLLTARSLVRPV